MILRLIDKFFPPEKVFAHCDIPCGIYDPYSAQIGAITVARMTQLLKEAKGDVHKVARLTAVKEEHAELVKNEVRIIWGDYFKPEHIEKFPETHNLVFDIMKLGSKVKQEVDEKASAELIAKVQRFAEIFWVTKGKKTKKVAAPSPSGGEMVLYE